MTPDAMFEMIVGQVMTVEVKGSLIGLVVSFFALGELARYLRRRASDKPATPPATKT